MADKPVEDDIRRLRTVLSYNSRTGVLRWKIKYPNTIIGAEAGCIDWRGYRLVKVDGRLLLAHRLAWALYYGAWPKGDLDHKNQNKGDNRIENLRLGPRAHNMANTRPKNKRGLPKGCYQLKGRNTWYSQIRINGALKRLGAFATAKEAAVAFQREHRAAHGQFSVVR
jgi:hypothetical protein